jgi:rubrerythrin
MPLDSTQSESQKAAAEITSDPASRKQFFKLMGGGGAAAFATLLAACGSDDDKKSGAAATTATAAASAPKGGDLGIVNYALTLEYLEADFYDKVVASGMFKGKQQALLRQIANTEQQHVDALTATAKKLGGTPAPKPQTKFPIQNPKQVVELAATVENLGAAAYLGQAANIQSKEILAAALAIHSVEGRHAAALNELAGKTITPDGAFAKPASMDEVLPKVKPFIVA